MSQLLEQAIASYIDPNLGMDYLTAGMVGRYHVAGREAEVTLKLGYPCQSQHDNIRAELEKAILGQSDLDTVNITIQQSVRAHQIAPSLKPVPGVKNIIAVVSGKGGVGKSTTSVNLALALAKEGARVGLLDADIYGPNLPSMLQSDERPQSIDGNQLKPVMVHGIQMMSIGYLIDNQDTAMIWRGPMVSRAVQQLLFDTAWEDLDYLIVDCPPGTGDIQLTIAQKIPVSAGILVATPQQVALLDGRKAVQMLAKVKIPLLGLIENMSFYQCPNCHQHDDIFGSGGASDWADEHGLAVLGKMPLQKQIQDDTNHGRPTVLAAPQSDITARYSAIARLAAAKLALQKKSYAAQFPNIVVEA